MKSPRLTLRQAKEAQTVMSNIVSQAGVEAEHYRPTRTNTNSFYGHHESSLQILGTLPLEPRPVTPENLAELGSDLIAGTLHNAPVQENDILAIGEVRYRLNRIEPHDLLGVRTHLELYLERVHQDEGS